MEKKKCCPKCGYEWEPRVKNPKECPECKKRLRAENSELRNETKEKPIYILIGKNNKELDRSTDLAKIINGWHTHFGSTIREKKR